MSHTCRRRAILDQRPPLAVNAVLVRAVRRPDHGIGADPGIVVQTGETPRGEHSDGDFVEYGPQRYQVPSNSLPLAGTGLLSNMLRSAGRDRAEAVRYRTGLSRPATL